MEYIIVYSTKINGILEQTNGLIAIKACCLLLDMNLDINKSFLPNTFNTSVYIPKQTFSLSFYFDKPLQV